jgi:hypothetical protein
LRKADKEKKLARGLAAQRRCACGSEDSRVAFFQRAKQEVAGLDTFI